MRQCFNLLAAIVIQFALCISAVAQVGTFTGLGFLPGASNSQALAVSNDGLVVVGSGSNSIGMIEGFRWTQASGMVGLGHLPGGNDSYALGVSGDGRVVVGASNSTSFSQEAFRWTQAGGMVGFGVSSEATGASFDGSIVVGGATQAFRWSEATGMVELGTLPGACGQSWAIAVTPDGDHIVGRSCSAVFDPQAFLWTTPGTMIGLGDLPGGPFWSLARGVSDDGLVVVGQSFSDPSGSYTEAFRWTAATGIIGLGDLPGGTSESVAFAANVDGSVIVGLGSSPATNIPNYYDDAIIWDANHGMRSLLRVLMKDYALDACGWRLTHAYDITPDGEIIVGSGINPAGRREAWLARVGAPRALADITGDGLIDNTDIGAFVSVLLGITQNCAFILRCDFNDDGSADGMDLQGFLRALH